MRCTITRTAEIPDQYKLARYSRAPELGPRLLFFSGGSAARDLSAILPGYTHNSIHLMTAFDSGGSSAVIRKAFSMLSVGDLRARLMSLADQTVTGAPHIFRLFAFRFPATQDNNALLVRLKDMIDGEDPLVAAIEEPMRNIICSHLHYFHRKMPQGFDLRGASIGNLILAGGFLNNNRNINPVLFLFSKLVEVRGHVRPVTDGFYHLGAHLGDGTTVVGQHLLTGKEVAPITAPIARLFLSEDGTSEMAVPPPAAAKIPPLLGDAECIVYSHGSYYTSILANLLPGGIGKAIARSGAPKVYIPSMGVDPEQLGMTLSSSVAGILAALRRDCPEAATPDLLNIIIIDSRSGTYGVPLDTTAVREMGITVLDLPLVTEQSSPWPDPKILAQTLLSLT
ncbi:GAK system CofD-like protein [Myxococcota bacterium]|nr:GAK system CofD-like protein [Myxococcota bacterium]MBU1534707.1 GAK system CofD-like protein [Myxococcota bacterium]